MGAFIGNKGHHCGGEQSLVGSRYWWEHSLVGTGIVAGSSLLCGGIVGLRSSRCSGSSLCGEQSL